ncbi:MAG: ABC transporter permease [Puia sp.]
MFKMYLAVLFRHIKKDIQYAFLPVLSLSIGLSIALLTVLYLSHEHSFDKFHSNYQRIYSIHTKNIFAGQEYDQNSVSYATGSRIAGPGGQVESFVRIQQPWQEFILSNPQFPDVRYKERKIYFTDPNFFSFFTFTLREGSPAQVLSRPFSMVISSAMAWKYFGHADPVGKTLVYNGKYHFQITGVFDPVPSNSSLDFDFVCPASALSEISQFQGTLNMNAEVGGGEFTTFLLLNKNARPVDVSRRLQAMSVHNQILKDSTIRFSLSPLASAHADMAYSSSASATYAGVVAWVAIGILCLAIINYIGLITSKGVSRSKEIGLRKVLGAEKSQIAGQFFLESMVLVVISFFCGLFLFIILRKYFLRILNLNIDLAFLANPVFILSAVSMLILITLLSGIYPSVLVSRFNPLLIISGRWGKSGGSAKVKTAFALFQFLVSYVCIIFSITLIRQMGYVKHRETGLNRDQVLLIPFRTTLGDHFASLKNDISNMPGVAGVAASRNSVYGGAHDVWNVKNYSGKDASLPVMLVDKNFFQVLGIGFVKPPLDSFQLTQPRSLVINEAAVQNLGLPGNPRNQKIDISGGGYFNVKAVMTNFNYQSLQNKITSLGLLIHTDSSDKWGQDLDGFLIVKLDKITDPQHFLSRTKTIYDRYDQQTPFSYQFLNDTYNALYSQEDHLAEGVTFLTGTAILLACLGLYSLLAFQIRSKMKAINIKKVLGATRMNIFVFITREILTTVLIAFVIAIPVSFYFISGWLNNFAYHINLGWFLFFGALILLLTISLLTISFQTLHIVRQNPVIGLKDN